MTCIVALIDNDKIYMGGDSAGVSGLSLNIRKDPKVFKKDEFIFGFTSSFRMGDILRYSFIIPERKKNQSIDNYMRTDFIDEIRKCLKEKGYAEKHHEAEQGGTFLVGYQGHLFLIDSDYQVGEHIEPYNACGCGERIALGSLFSTQDLPPRKRIIKALEAAEFFSAGVRGPFTVLSL